MENTKTAVLYDEDAKMIEQFEIRQDLYQLVKDFLNLVKRNTLESGEAK